MSGDYSIGELEYRWPAVVKNASEGWEKSFALSIAKKLRWKNWTPTAKQEAHMQRMVRALIIPQEPDEDFSLIET